MTKGQQLLGGILSPEEIEEFDALEEISANLTDANGSTGYGMLPFINRRTQLLRKASTIFTQQNEKALNKLNKLMESNDNNAKTT